ncbi:hypothetical protein SPRG_20941 [Saprolegnia parasitica CBS 223.65]|uniref:IPT/TIG domain-containing protein n=1 Tax=Saprolegnia parasitica (strain CBS 223.65) TaxID=695850 RepID=A0A067BYK9_SAPPC|nr:hypothetical protein SPRG_20941 [Saprolegnia parasitica CBS 223.65]KDO23609.1 hypothetical protein SPRG_20941 [Saprolegnia parasitica CBS 223.65]|eukprot:XP_012205765.1 hypothetical protein SPRG_20941 [Saprolegnia parasitica CBS 223.65]
MAIEIRMQQMFDIGQLKCRIRFAEPETPDAPYRIASTNLSIVSFSVDDQVVHASIPPFADWRVDTISPHRDESDVDDETKSSPPSRAWYQPDAQWFTTTVQVSLNGGATYLPPISPGVADVVAYTPGTLETITPTSGPLSGSTLVTLRSNYFHYDTNDAMVSIEYNGDIQFVPGFVKTLPEATDRALTFEMPTFFVPPPLPIESPRPGAPVVYPPAPMLPNAIVKVALNGATYAHESSVPFEFYYNPKVVTVEPSTVSPGVVLQMTGELFRTGPLAKYKFTNVDGSFSADVQPTLVDEKGVKLYKVEIPALGKAAEGELWFYVALNGVQYSTSDAAKVTYVDQPEPPTKDDKRKH